MARGRKSASERRMLTAGLSWSARAEQSAGGDEVPLLEPGASRQTARMADEARRRLEEMIVTLQLKPGSIWSEAELSERLGLGRTPVREALKRLEGEHLVEIVPRNGAKITEIDVMEQLLMLEMRRELERLVATSASLRATADERKKCIEIAGHFRGMRDVGIVQFHRYHTDAKRFLTECARNPFAANAIMPCYAMSRRFYYLHHRVMHDVPVAAGHHARVFEAVALGDEKRAVEATDALMDYVSELTRRTVIDRF